MHPSVKDTTKYPICRGSIRSARKAHTGTAQDPTTKRTSTNSNLGHGPVKGKHAAVNKDDAAISNYDSDDQVKEDKGEESRSIEEVMKGICNTT